MSLSPCVPPTPWVTETSARLPIQSEDSLLPHSQPDASTQAPQAYPAHPAPSQLLLFAKLRCGPSPQQSSPFPGGEPKALLVSAPWPAWHPQRPQVLLVGVLSCTTPFHLRPETSSSFTTIAFGLTSQLADNVPVLVTA